MGSMLIQNAIDLVFEDDDTQELVKLKSNDIDVLHGEFSDTKIH